MVGATNLTLPCASIFATFSFRGTELAKTDITAPFFPRVDDPLNVSIDGNNDRRLRTQQTNQKLANVKMTGMKTLSHIWTTRQHNACTIPLPEECSERCGVEIEIDLWEEGGPKKGRGDHLGQVSRVYYRDAANTLVVVDVIQLTRLMRMKHHARSRILLKLFIFLYN